MNHGPEASILLLKRDERLKERLQSHLESLGFCLPHGGGLTSETGSKDAIRYFHAEHRQSVLEKSENFAQKSWPDLKKFFASGSQVAPDRISPRIEQVISHTWQARLFRLASLTWSVPVSRGFGRRLRFLVWDDFNGKLIGIFAIGDPVFNLGARDRYIGWSGADRVERLVNVMDAYVLGAIPPYNALLGGKLIACLVRTIEVYNAFRERYSEQVGVISGQTKPAHLLAVTTSSSMGRSSIYNRLKLHDEHYLSRIGYSGGWGHFHVSDELFSELRNYLRATGHSYADEHQFGKGSNWRIRTIRAALTALGVQGDMLKHGIQREVFISLFAANSLELLSGTTTEPPALQIKSVSEVAFHALERWVIPRAIRRPEFKNWQSDDLAALIFGRDVALKLMKKIN